MVAKGLRWATYWDGLVCPAGALAGALCWKTRSTLTSCYPVSVKSIEPSDHAVDRPRAGSHPWAWRIQGGSGQGLGGGLGAAGALGRAHADAQQQFDQRRHLGIHVLGGQQHQLDLQVRVGARAQHRGAERVHSGDSYAPEPGLDAVFLLVDRHRPQRLFQCRAP